MITDQLKAACEKAEKLSLKDQDMLAKKILEEIEAMEWDEKWDATLATPESPMHSWIGLKRKQKPIELLVKVSSISQERALQNSFSGKFSSSIITSFLPMSKSKPIEPLNTLSRTHGIPVWNLSALTSKKLDILCVLIKRGIAR